MQDNKSPITTNNLLPNIWVDAMTLGVRGDGVCAISFSANMPKPVGHVEQVRMMTSKELMKQFIELACREVDHYPVKQEPEEPTSEKH